MAWLARILILLSVFWFSGVIQVHADRIPDRFSRSILVFTTFPSEGMGLLFERILREAYARIGYDVVMEKVPAERALVMANQGKVDGEAARVSVIEPNCPNLIRVPTPLYVNRVVVFTKRKDIDPAKGWGSLSRYKVGSVLGYKYIQKKTANMNRVLALDYRQLFTMLVNDRIDVAVTEYFEVLPILRVMDPEGIKMLLPPLDYKSMYHYLHKRHAALVPKIDSVLRAMREEGRMEAIQREMEQEPGRPSCMAGCVVPCLPPGP